VSRYLTDTTDYHLVYGRPSSSDAPFVHRNESHEEAPFDVYGYCGSDYAGCVDDRHFMAGWVFMAAGGATSWQSQ
jgi:hypothetical protein